MRLRPKSAPNEPAAQSAHEPVRPQGRPQGACHRCTRDPDWFFRGCMNLTVLCLVAFSFGLVLGYSMALDDFQAVIDAAEPLPQAF